MANTMWLLRVVLLLSWLSAVVRGFGFLAFPPAVYHDVKTVQQPTATVETFVHPTFFGTFAHQKSDKVGVLVTRDLVDEFNQRVAFADLRLRDLGDLITPTCGNSRIAGVLPANVYNASHLLWRSDDPESGFPVRTGGPCEVWIDDKRVLRASNCPGEFVGSPAKIPIRFTECKKKACVLRFYWFVVNHAPWKMIKHCVLITSNPRKPLAMETTEPVNKTLVVAPVEQTSTTSLDLTITLEQILLDDDESVEVYTSVE